jgi:hypothetical protein
MKLVIFIILGQTSVYAGGDNPPGIPKSGVWEGGFERLMNLTVDQKDGTLYVLDLYHGYEAFIRRISPDGKLDLAGDREG